MEIFRAISSSSQSVVVLPSAIFPQREVRPEEIGRGPAPGKLELREENGAAAPGSPWGGGEGRMNRPWSSLLTRRMLAQGEDRSNAGETKNQGGPGKLELEKVAPTPGKKYPD